MFDPTAAGLSGHGAAIAATLEEHSDALVALSKDIHAHPEIAFEEHRSSAAIEDFLEARGFDVQRGAGGLDTAFVASVGGGDFVVAFCVEYDALAGVGHGCGHNIILGASVGAAVALAPLADELGIQIRAIGTPAEEHGGGKPILIDAGVFDDVSMAMMIHPAPQTSTMNVVGSTSNSVVRYRVTFTGRGAHAAAHPSDGVNAADATVIAQVALGLLRQQLPDSSRVAAIVREAGELTNIIPARSVVDFEVRATTLAAHDDLLARARRCFEAGALASGCSVEFTELEPLYEPLTQNELIGELWNEGMARLGYSIEGSLGLSPASTDMGNVSNRIPAIHPFAGITGVEVPLHTAAFRDAADTDPAYDLMLQSALVMAWASAQVAADPQHRQRILDDRLALRAALEGQSE